ncbi:MAG: ATP-binding protein [Aureliella sp.]
MSSLYVIRGQDNGTHFPIRGGVASLGRGAACTIRLNDTEVSRQHAKIIRNGDLHDIVDNGSSNGTFVNSRRVQRQTLRGGDRIQIGRSLLIYTGGPEPHDSVLAVEHNPVESVEVVAGDVGELSRITGSLESQQSVASSAGLSSLVTPAGSSAPKRRAESSLPNLGTKPIEELSPHARSESVSKAEPFGKTLSGDDQPQHSAGIESDSGGGAENELSRASVDGESDWETVFRVSNAVRRTVDLGQLLSQILELIFESIPCDRGCILMFDTVTGDLRPSCSRERDPAGAAPARATKRLRISQTILDHVVQHREGVLTSNAQDDERWENVESIASIGINEAICVPMLGRYGLVGTVYVDTTQSAGKYASGGLQATFDRRQLRLLMAIANQAALAIEDTQFYQAMLQSERLAAMGQTIANLSHHVKNVLQGIKGGAFLVDDGLKKENLDVIGRGWNIVQRNQDRIGNLVMDMLSFSKDREPELDRGDVCELLVEVVELLKIKASDQGVALDFDASGDPVFASFDGEALHRAVLNVILNAIEATAQSEQERPRVELSARLDPESNMVSIVIADNGPGIAEEDLSRIFAPFESSKGARGTGLGLPVSQKILREHGGHILVKSPYLRDGASGTQFTLTWPATQAADSDAGD